MADSLDVKIARLSGIRQGLVLGAGLVIIVWMGWLIVVDRGPASWIPIAMPIFAVSFLLDAFISHRQRKRRDSIVLLVCFGLLLAMTVYGSIYAPVQS